MPGGQLLQGFNKRHTKANSILARSTGDQFGGLLYPGETQNRISLLVQVLNTKVCSFHKVILGMGGATS